MVAALLAALPRAYVEEGQPCPQVAFGPERLPVQLTASGRRALRRAESKLDRAGHTMTIDRIRDPAEVRRLVPDLVALHRDRDHFIGRRSDLDDPGRRAFYSAVVSRLAGSGRVEVFALRLDGTLAAYLLGFRDGPVFRIWDGRISAAFPELSLGVLVRTALLTALLADPELTGVDMGRGTLQHKMHGVTEVVPAVVVRAESSPRVRLALRWAARLRRIAAPPGSRRPAPPAPRPGPARHRPGPGGAGAGGGEPHLRDSPGAGLSRRSDLRRAACGPPGASRAACRPAGAAVDRPATSSPGRWRGCRWH